MWKVADTCHASPNESGEGLEKDILVILSSELTFDLIFDRECDVKCEILSLSGGASWLLINWTAGEGEVEEETALLGANA